MYFGNSSNSSDVVGPSAFRNADEGDPILNLLIRINDEEDFNSSNQIALIGYFPKRARALVVVRVWRISFLHIRLPQSVENVRWRRSPVAKG